MNLDWLVALSVAAQTLAIGIIASRLGTQFHLGVETALWFIFGAILSVGLSGLRGQAAGIGRIIDLLQQGRT